MQGILIDGTLPEHIIRVGGTILRKNVALFVVSVIVAFTTVPTGEAGSSRYTYAQIKRAVCTVFGPRCEEAMGVVACETGETYDVWAGYGKHQYLGLFQMGERERARYGHAWNPWAQARAAYRYFVASGSDWSPWQCMPDGRLRW